MTEQIQEKKLLPTDRINIAKQFDILRAYGAQYEATNKPVKNEDVAKIVKMKDTTVSLSNAFFNDTKLIQRSEAGGYTPCPEVVSFCRAYQWNKETAAQKLAPAIERTWFAKALLPKLKFSAIEEKDAIQHLGEETATDKESEPQLRMLIEFLLTCGLVVREGTLLKLVQQAVTPTPPKPPKPDSQNGGENDNPEGGSFAEVKGMVRHALPLKKGRQVIVYTPASISQAELKRIQDWLGLQLLIDEANEGGAHE